MDELGGLDEGGRRRAAGAVGVAPGLRGEHWQDAGGRWRSGRPPLDWRRDEKGRWHPTAVPEAVRVPPTAPGWQPPIGPVAGDEPREIGGKRPSTGPVEVVRSWPVWIKGVMAASVLVLGAAVVSAATSGGSGDDQVVAAPSSTVGPASEGTTGSTPATTAPPTTVAPPATTAPAPPPTAAAEPAPTAPATTAPPATSPAPPPTEAPSADGGVHPGSFCSPAGIGGVTVDGTPMTCANAKCDGTPYDQPRWRSTTC